MEPNDFSSSLNSSPDSYVKSAPRILNTAYKSSNNADKKVPAVKSEILTTKNALKYLLEGRLRKMVCRYCLNVASPLSELDQVLQIAGAGVFYKITIKDMVASFHPFKVANDPNFPNKICNKCLNRTISSYLFTQQCERSERALRNCFEDMYKKLDKLDPIEPKQKKRGRQKIHPNYNILYTEHENVIDYAEPIINIVNRGSELTNNDENNTINEFECLKCWQVFPNMFSLINHEKLHPKTMYYHCRRCGRSFTKPNLLRRHIRTAHDLGKELQTQKSDFKCLECGFVCADYNRHLQHIEKHKFQMVMQHLVERNMDKLCSVCFDKNCKLVDLDQMVCLHGGYPEMMGDRTLYNILGSAVPEKSSYKYQELLVPNQAKVISIIKNSKKPETINKQMEKPIFKLPSPIIVSGEYKELNDAYEFIFSSPHEDHDNVVVQHTHNNNIPKDNSPSVEHNIDKSIKDNVSNNNESLHEEINSIIDVTELPIDKAMIEIPDVGENDAVYCDDKIILDGIFSLPKEFNENEFTFSNPEIIKPTENKEEHSNPAEVNDIIMKKSCDICWIFKKPTCNKCLNMESNENVKSPSHVIEKEINTQIKKECQFCWVFQNCDKCDYCKKVNKFVTKVVSSEEIGEKPKEVNDALYNTKSAPMKRKMISDDDCKSKRLKWQCQICLTVNMNRELCVCCDAQRFLNKGPLKVNLNYNKDFFSTLNDKDIINCTTQTDNDTLESKANNDEIPDVNVENAILHPENKETAQIQVNSKEMIASCIVVQPVFGFNANLVQDNSYQTKTTNKEVIHEEMEIELEDLNKPELNSDAMNLSPVSWEMSDSIKMICGNPLPSFQFQMGSTMSQDKKSARRIRKPLRRSAASFNK